MTVKLEPCPHCGTLLTPSLVKAIKDPTDYSSMCPKRPKVKSPARATIDRTVVSLEAARLRMVAFAAMTAEVAATSKAVIERIQKAGRRRG